MDPYGLTPEEEQRIAAESLRSQQVLGAASARGGRFDNLAAISQLINNKAAAEAAGAAQQRAIQRSKPAQLGNTGFMVDGEFAPNPGATQEKLEQRGQQRDMALQRAQQAVTLQKERLAASAEQAGLNRDLRRDLANQSASLRQALSAAKGGAGAKAGTGEGKTLAFGAIDKMTAREGVRDAYVDLTGSFKKEFAGTPGLAGLENMGGRFLPGLTGKGDQANWWQNYQEQTNKVRNELFGSALTATEKAAFDAQNIVPGMDGAQIERRLAQQAFIADKAYSKIVNAAKTSGYNTSAFNPDMVSAPALKPGQAASGKLTEEVPKGVDAEDWKFMTPAERKLFGAAK